MEEVSAQVISAFDRPRFIDASALSMLMPASRCSFIFRILALLMPSARQSAKDRSPSRADLYCESNEGPLRGKFGRSATHPWMASFRPKAAD